MSDVPIVDAHVHLWNPHMFPIPWLAEVPAINHQFGLAEYKAQTMPLPIAGMVYVEVDVAPQFALLEAEYAVELAAHDPRLLGIVAAAPVQYGAQVRIYLDTLRKLGPLIKGVRRNLQGEVDPSYCLQATFIQGVQLLAEYGYSFDICIRHEQLPAVTELVKRCPDVTFILDHCGKPAIRAHLLDPWRMDLDRLAALPNICCKVSGLLTEADPQKWSLADLAPYVEHALAVFGEQRMLFGGDWPVILQAGSYRQWVETIIQLLSHLPESTQRAIWGENARRYYRLGNQDAS
ncbi:MAG: amidohydrolase family protein [Ktedonobacteraceae bacterium]|nr:amidohydrolase family protein [Chloroflexota bacterium]